MVHVLCTRINSAIEVERSRDIYANLKSILTLLEMEQSHDYRAEKNKNLYLSDEINIDRFLREGTGYVAMINNLNGWITSKNSKNMVLRRTMNVLGRVQFQYKRMLRMRALLRIGIVPYDIREDIIISPDDVVRENQELKVNTADEYDIDEYEIIEFYDWQSEWKTRTKLLRTINLLISEIHNVIAKRYLTLYSILKKFCKRATKFLYRNRTMLKSSKLRQRLHRRNSCCEYHFLKQFIACCRHVLLCLSK